ncbi:MAG: bifunctional adenosylcobinamide kinase/adenosylcobinamide-phosphate guanylyltransferase [Sphingomonadales bacterium]|nr:MAG: bifunctional adenosylcobinamide kinase/adenosylcobinamide-phosphate guanylyltransferase [Sphingomonadales bacterium]
MIAKTLFVGGARSGKSRLALATAERHAGPLHYLATAENGDAEMAERIAMHQAERSAQWRTVECPLDLPEAIAAISSGVILVDCLTLWLSNLMLGNHPIERRSNDLLAAIAATPLPLVIVTNEVGLGIVPAHPLGREFRDMAGRLNQKVAAGVDAAYFVVSGMVLPLHKFG